MSNINTKQQLLYFHNKVKNYDLTNIISEGPENCQHNNSKIYYQGIVHDKNKKYFIISYQNPIEQDNIKKLFVLSNENKNRTNNSIATMGEGIKLLFHKLAKRIHVVSDNDNINYTRLNLEKHMKDVINSKSNNLEVLDAKNCISEIYDSLEDFKNDKGIIANIINKIKKNIIDNNIEPPKSFIIIEVNKNMEEECIKSQQECKIIFGTKFNYNNIFNMYLFDLDITNDKFTIDMVEKKDILGLNNKEDSATFYVKCINNHCIVYLKEDKKTTYYKRTLNGTSKNCNWKLITNSYLKSICKDLECKDLDSYDLSVNFYRIEEKYFDKIKGNIETNSTGYTGVYLMTAKDQNLINFKPYSWHTYCNYPVGRHDYWGLRSRLFISINNKKYFDIRGIKIETKPTVKTARLIKDLFRVFKNTKSYNMATKRKKDGGGSSYKTLCKNISINELNNIFIPIKSIRKKKKAKDLKAKEEAERKAKEEAEKKVIKNIVKLEMELSKTKDPLQEYLNDLKKQKHEKRKAKKAKEEAEKKAKKAKEEAERKVKEEVEIKNEITMINKDVTIKELNNEINELKEKLEMKEKIEREKKEGYLYALEDETRPKMIKLGQTTCNMNTPEGIKKSGYTKRYFPFIPTCLKTIKVLNRFEAEKKLFKKCAKARINDSEWFNKKEVIELIDKGLFEKIKKNIEQISKINNDM